MHDLNKLEEMLAAWLNGNAFSIRDWGNLEMRERTNKQTSIVATSADNEFNK